MKKKIVLFLCVAIVLIGIVIIGLSIYSGNKWKKGIYVLDNIIELYSEEGDMCFEMSSIIVGESLLDKVKEKQVNIYVRTSSDEKQVEYEINNIVENGRYYEVDFNLTIKQLQEGKYDIEKIIIKDNKKILDESECNGYINVCSKNSITKDIKIQNTMHNVLEDSIEMIYIIENNTDSEIVINEIKSEVVNQVTIRYLTNVSKNGNANLNKLKAYDEAITIDNGKDAYIMITIPNDKNSFEKIQYSPEFIITYNEKEYKVPAFYRTLSISAPYDAEEVLKFVEREN